MNCIRYIKYKRIKHQRNRRKLLIDDKGKLYDISNRQTHIRNVNEMFYLNKYRSNFKWPIN